MQSQLQNTIFQLRHKIFTFKYVMTMQFSELFWRSKVSLNQECTVFGFDRSTEFFLLTYNKITKA